VRIEIEDALAEMRSPSAASRSKSVRIWPIGVAASLAVAIIAAATLGFLRSGTDADGINGQVMRLALPNLGVRPLLPFGLRSIAITRDGSHVIYTSNDGVWVYGLTGERSYRVDELAFNPFVSPRGDRYGYFDATGSRLVTAPIEGGTAQTLAMSTERNLGADWGIDDTVVFAMTSGLYAVPADGSESPRLLAAPDRAAGEQYFGWPEILPDGGAAVFTVIPPDTADAQPSLALYDFETNRVSPLLPAAASARFVSEDRLLFMRNDALMTVGFDRDSHTVSGNPIAVSDVSVAVAADYAAAEYDVADNGTLIHIADVPGPATGTSALYWSDRDGNEELLPLPRATYIYPRVSPDGTRISFERIFDGNRDIWIYDIARQSTSRFTTGPTEDMLAVWSPDGSRIYFASDRAGNFDIYSKPSDGSTDARIELQRPIFETPMFFARSPDELVVFEEFSNVSVVDLASKRVSPLLDREATDAAAGVSPDGKWLLYLSDESGPGWEVYLRRFDNLMEQRIQVSTDGGTFPMWGLPGSNEIYYVSLEGEFMAVPVELEPELRLGTPVKLFDTTRPPRGLAGRPFDISPVDGRFLLTRFYPNQDQRPGAGSVSVVLNWGSDLEAQLAVQ